MKKLITPLLLCICAAINLKAQPQQTLKKASNIERNAIDNSVSSVTLTGDANYKIGQASELFRDYLELNTNKTQLVLRNSSVSKKGITTERYDQYCNGVKVENGVYTVMYGKDSRANFMNGNFYKSIPTSSTPTLNEKTAVAKALRAVNARKYAWEMEGLEQQLKIEKKDNNATYYPKGELVWIEDYTAQKSDRKLHLAYKFNVYAMEPLSRHHIYVDAKSGKILHKKSLIDQISGTGTTLYSGPVSFQTSILSGVNKLRDSTRGMGINTFSCANTTGTTVVDVTSASTVWATDASLDAHWGASKVFDYFMLEQGRNSFDDAGAAINSYVHFGVNYNNAFWNGSQMVYGDGSGLPSGFSPLTSLDVCAHEIGHAICQYTADLIYEKESGAMNEGFSDIWAAIIEEYADPHETDAVAKDKWKIGEEIGTNPIRRMDNPNIRYQPDTYSGSYWVNVSGCTPAEANDYCGVHTNSGVLNYWFYLLCNGGSGTNDISNAFSVSGIGTAKGADIAYQTELMLTPTSTYAGCRTASISAATALYGICSPEVEAVTRAWYAVGVGSNYTTPTLPAITGASSICQGSNTTFSIASVGGTWSSSNTSVATVGSATGTVSGIASGTTRITYNGGACIATKIITVNPLPISSPITVPASVCGEGDFVYITTPGPDYSYIETTHPDNIYQSPTWSERLRVYNNTTSTIYATVYYIAINTCGTDTATYPIAIKPMPANIVGEIMMNVGTADTLTNISPGGTWSNSDPSKAYVNSLSGIVTPLTPGIDTMYYTLPAGCFKSFTIVIDDGYPNAVGKINTIIGNGTAGYSPDGTYAASAMVNSPNLIDIDSAGNIYYVDGRYLRKKGIDNIITTIAGNGSSRVYGGEFLSEYGITPATAIPLRDGITSMAVDKYGNVYIYGNGGIEKIGTDGHLSIFAGHTYYMPVYSGLIYYDAIALGIDLGFLYGMCIDNNGDLIYTDNMLGTVNKINAITNRVNTIAGRLYPSPHAPDDGIYNSVAATTAYISGPTDVAVGKDGSIYIAESLGAKVLKINTSGILYTLAGQTSLYSSTYGNGSLSKLARVQLNKIAIDSSDNIYISDGAIIRKISNIGIINAFAGTGSTAYNGECKNADVANIAAIDFAVDKDGGLIFAEGGNNRIRKIQNPDLYSPTITGRFTLTTDDTSQLAASLPTGTWSSSNTSVATVDATGKVISLSIGTTTISYMLADTCRSPIATAVINVTIAPEDTLTLSGITSVCTGTSSTIAASISGGTWTSSNTSIATVNTAGIVTGVAPGTSIISYIVSDSTGTDTATIAITIIPSHPDTPILSGTDVMCALSGYYYSFTASISGGTWSSSNTAVASIASTTGAITALTGGTCTMTYTISNSCGTTIATRTITVNTTIAAGTITGPIAVYTGNDISLSATPAGGVWSSSNTAVATVNTTGTVSGVSMGSVVISYSQGSTCGGDTATHLVEVFEVLSTNITGATTVCSGASTSLSNATSGGTWSSSNTAIATINSTSGVATGLAVGTAIISYKVAPGYLAIATLTVNTVPEIASISGGTDVCVGSTSALSSATSGGFWYSTNSAIVTVNASGLATGVSLGSAAIVYAVSGACGIGFNSVVMNVSNPSPITGADNVCVSATITLTNSSVGGTWSSSNANATVSTSGIVTGISAGTVIISYSLPCGTLTKLLTINPLPNVGTISGAATVNAGSTTTFTTTGTSGTWSSSDLAIATVCSTGVVNGISAGSATISYTASNSCGTNSATKSITVLPVLETGITGTLNVCVSGTTALSNTTAGGTWSSGNTSVATISSSGVVTGIAAGTAVISYSLYDSYVTAIVTVNTMPVLGTISGSSSVCVGNSNSLTNATAGGTWSSSNETVATVGAAGSVTGVGEGTATITYSVTNACGTSVATKVQTVLPLPVVAVISGASTICRTTTITLTSSVSGGTWSSNYTAGASVSATGVVTGLANGNYIISYRTTNSCGTSYASHAVSVISAPVSYAISGTATVCQSATTTLSNAATGGSWSSSNTSVATVAPTTGVVTGVTTGTANITYNITNLCGSASASKIVTVNPLPVSGIISGTTTLSAGTSATLSSSVPGGSWLSANTAVATINSTTGMLNGISGGVTTISYTKTNSCGSAITTVAVTITAAITPITGTRVVCVNANTTLANTTSGGTWSTADGAIATVNATTGVVTGVNTGTTTVTYTFSGSGNTTAIITVNPTPAAYTGSGIICTGSQLNLGSIIPGCTWSSSTPARASVVSATGIVTGGATLGTVNISYTNASSCRTITQLTVNGAVANITGLSSPCVGGTFTALNSTTGGTWSSSNTTRATIHPTSGLVTAVGGGTVTLTYSVSAGCYKTATATIGTPPSITGNASACVGATTTLVSSGGTWSSSNTSIATVAGSGVVTGISLGIANITYRSSSNAACFVTKEVTVNAMPTAITPATVVCPGATATLMSSPTGGVWTSNNSSAASVDATSGVVTGVVNNYSGISIVVIRYTLPSTCSVTTIVTVNPLPAPIGGGNRNICIAGTTTLTSSTSGATWSSASPSVASITSGGAVTGLAAGLATISYTNALGCANTAVVTVNAVPGANTGTATICIPSGTTTLSNAAGTGTWSSSNASRASVNLSTGVVTGINTGTANITYTKAAGCISVTQVTVSSCSARPELTDESVGNTNIFTVAPNPTTGAINITTDLSGTISVFSIDGKQIVQSEVKEGTNSITLPSDIKTGIYLLRFVGSDGVIKSVRLVYNQ